VPNSNPFAWDILIYANVYYSSLPIYGVDKDGGTSTLG